MGDEAPTGGGGKENEIQRRLREAQKTVNEAIKAKKRREAKGETLRKPMEAKFETKSSEGPRKGRQKEYIYGKTRRMRDERGNTVRNPPLHEGFPGGEKALRQLESAIEHFFGQKPTRTPEAIFISAHMERMHNGLVEEAQSIHRAIRRLRQRGNSSDTSRITEMEKELEELLHPLNAYRRSIEHPPVRPEDLDYIKKLEANEPPRPSVMNEKERKRRRELKQAARVELLRVLLANHTTIARLTRQPHATILRVLHQRIAQLKQAARRAAKPTEIPVKTGRQRVLERIKEQEANEEREHEEIRQSMRAFIQLLRGPSKQEAQKWANLVDQFVRIKLLPRYRQNEKVQLLCNESILECLVVIRQLHSTPRARRA